jgi:hypothetical protein
MSLADNINGRISDIDTRIASIKEEAQGKILSLQKEKFILNRALSLINSDIEQAFDSLKDIGIIKT